MQPLRWCHRRQPSQERQTLPNPLRDLPPNPDRNQPTIIDKPDIEERGIRIMTNAPTTTPESRFSDALNLAGR
jgi:hypothetical protein